MFRAVTGFLRREAGDDQGHRQDAAERGAPGQDDPAPVFGRSRYHRLRSGPALDANETPIRGTGAQNIAPPRTTTTSTPYLDADQTARQEAYEAEAARAELARLRMTNPRRGPSPPVRAAAAAAPQEAAPQEAAPAAAATTAPTAPPQAAEQASQPTGVAGAAAGPEPNFGFRMAALRRDRRAALDAEEERRRVELEEDQTRVEQVVGDFVQGCLGS